MDFIVKLAKLEDLETLRKLNEEFNGVDPSLLKTNLWTDESSEIVAIAYSDGNGAGFACAQSYVSFCYNAPYGEITEMYVREEYRGNGIANSLITCLENELQSRGVNSIKILTGRENDAAIKCYAKAGYIAKSEVVLHKKIKLGSVLHFFTG